MRPKPQSTPTTPKDSEKRVVKFPPPTGRELIDLAEWPVVTMHHTPVKQAVRIPNLASDGSAEGVLQGWELALRNVELGAPNAGDQDIYVAITAFLHETDFRERVLRVTRADICRVLGWQPGKNVYARIREGLSRLRNVTYKGENIFRDPDTGARFGYIEFGFIDSFAFSDRPPKRSKKHPQPELPLSYVRVSDEFLILCRRGNLKLIDLAFYRSLSRPETRWLFRFLDKNLHRRSEYRIGLRKLRLRQGLNPDYDPKYIKRDLKPRLEELVAKGFLSTWSFERGHDAEDPWQLHVSRIALQRAESASGPSCDVSAQGGGERAAEGRIRRNSGPSVEGSAAELVRFFHETFHGARRTTPTRAEISKAAVFQRRCGGDAAQAKACITWIRAEAQATGFAIQSFGALLTNGYPERFLASREAAAAARREHDERVRRTELQLAYDEFFEEEAQRLFEALPPDAQGSLIELAARDLDRRFGARLDSSAWTTARRHEWARRQAIAAHAKGKVASPQEWLAKQDDHGSDQRPPG